MPSSSRNPITCGSEVVGHSKKGWDQKKTLCRGGTKKIIKKATPNEVFRCNSTKSFRNRKKGGGGGGDIQESAIEAELGEGKGKKRTLERGRSRASLSKRTEHRRTMRLQTKQVPKEGALQRQHFIPIILNKAAKKL